jgi:5-formyltetrahydrofolate cyclo-ligase
MGAVSGRILVRHIWFPPDVNASVDFPATTHGGPVTLPPYEVQVDQKQLLRARFRKVRREHVAALPRATYKLLFLRPPAPIAALAGVGATVGLYHAISDEAPTRAYAQWFYENDRAIALPWFLAEGEPMRFRTWHDPFEDDGLEPGPYGVLQPRSDAPEVTPALTFVPLLAFSSHGERLGQGGGHYDRWLASHGEVQAVGLAWDCQLADGLPCEPHDRRLHAVVTPTRYYEGTA